MAQITFKQIEAFVQVADLASFRRAAERLNTTQPNISARISGLESQLNLKLFERGAGAVRLTPAGDTMLARAREVLGAMDGFLVAAGQDHLFDGILRLGVTEMIVHSWLGAFLTRLKERFPNIDVDLTVDVSVNLTELLENRSIDLALQTGPFSRRFSGQDPLGDFPLIWVAAPGLGLAGARIDLQELAATSVLTHARGTLPFEQLKAHFAAERATSVRLVPSNNFSACLQMTRDGLGVACVPRAMVEAEIAAGDLVAVDYPWTPDPLSFWARYDAETAPSFVQEAARLAKQVSG